MNTTTKSILTLADFARAASRLDCDIAAIRAVAEIEAPLGPFLDTGEPTILFERHYFHKLTKGKYDGAKASGVPVRCALISSPVPGGYGPYSAQHTRLQAAARLDRDAALKSASWGMFQIMGANYLAAGHDTIQSFVNAMYRSAGDHLDAFVAFVISKGLDQNLRHYDWRGFAFGYNGKNYAKNNYHVKIASAYDQFSRLEHRA